MPPPDLPSFRDWLDQEVERLGLASRYVRLSCRRDDMDEGVFSDYDWRTGIDIPPVMHSNPIPMASRVGNLLFSSGISGRDANTGQPAATIEEQCAWCFRNMAKVLDLAGATMGDVGRVLVWMRDPATRPHFNNEWVKAFPDEHSRPARHVFFDGHGPEVTMEIIAVIEPK